MTNHYQVIRYYSATTDAEMARISMFDSRGSEFWTEVQAGGGRKWRVARERAVELIANAIESGDEPGEVIV